MTNVVLLKNLIGVMPHTCRGDIRDVVHPRSALSWLRNLQKPRVYGFVV